MMGDLTRRIVLTRGAGLVAAAVATPLLGAIGQPARVAEAAVTTNQQTNANRAVAAYNAMQQYFSVPDGSSLYRETYPWTGGKKYSFLWPFSRAMLGTLALAGVPASLVGGTSYSAAVQDRLTGLARYWDGQANPPAYDSYVVAQGGGDKYHDDNAWIGLALIEQYRMGLTTLDRAKQLFTYAQSGWDANAGDSDAGGIFWVQQGAGAGLTNHDRGAGATAGPAELGFHLHLLTGSSTYDGDGTVVASPGSLGATNMMNWVNAYLDSGKSGTGVYWNVVRSDGSVDTNLWSYNQGVMIGANILRYELTTNTTYLTQAAGIANNALTYYGTFTSQPPSFNAMLFQNLLMLYPYSNTTLQSTILQTMQSYGDWAWTNTSARNSRTNLFYFNDAGQPSGGTGQRAQLRDQGAMTQLYALLAWSSSDYGKLT
jgi:hypothetical protein